MGLPSPGLRPADGAIVGIDPRNSLANGLVFSWDASRPSENLVKFEGGASAQAGGVGIRTNVQNGYGTQLGTACKFAGGAEGISDINFGTLAETAGLHMGPFTVAIIGTVDAAFSTLGVAAWCCHSDNNSDRGFNVYSDSVYWLRLSLIRPTNGEWNTNLNQPNVGDTVLIVLSYDGGATMTSSVKCYVNGILTASAATTDPSGTTGAATAESLYIGRNRSGNNSAHNGRIAQVLLWNRVLTDDEFSAWNANPWQIYKTRKTRVVSSAAPPPPSANGNFFFAAA